MQKEPPRWGTGAAQEPFIWGTNGATKGSRRTGLSTAGLQSVDSEGLVRVGSYRPQFLGRHPALHDGRLWASLYLDAVDHQRRPPIAVSAPGHDEHLAWGCARLALSLNHACRVDRGRGHNRSRRGLLTD